MDLAMYQLAASKSVLAAVFLWSLVASVGAYSQPWYEECRRRDEWCSRHTFVWDVQITVALQLSKAEREMLESRQRNIHIPEQKRVHGQLVISRSPRLTYIGHTQDQATLSSQLGRYEYWFGKDFVLVMSHEQTLPDMPAPALVLPAPDDALYMGVFLPPISDELANQLQPAFLAGADPFRVFAPATWFRWRKGSWSLRERRGDVVIFQLVTDIPYLAGEFHLDVARRFAPAFFSVKSGTRHRLEYSVQEWRRVEGGWWIPARVKITETGSAHSGTATLMLRQVTETPPGLRIDLPRGTPVSDLRHISPDTIASSGLLFVQGKTYRYAWTGELPAKGVLPAISSVSSQPFTMVGSPPRVSRSSGLPILLLLVGTFAILVGTYWYWRIKWVERQQ
jgi:hypothetical protein